MFIWDFVADKILGQIVNWFYGQVVGFLGNFFAEMGNMGVELFEMSWVQSIVLFFSYLAWALYGTGLVVACFECGIEYSSGRGNIRETALNAIKGFMAVSLFTVVPVRLYELSVTLQGQLTAGITGYGASIGDVASDITPIPEIQVQEAFCRLYYKLKHQSIPILEQMLTNLQMIRNRRMLWSPDIVALNKRISDISSQNQTLAFLKQQCLVDPDIFIVKTNELTKQLRQAKLEKEKLMDAESDMTALQTRDLIDLLEDGPEFLDSFDTELFGELVEKIIIESNDSVRFCLKNGLELRESIERTVR